MSRTAAFLTPVSQVRILLGRCSANSILAACVRQLGYLRPDRERFGLAPAAGSTRGWRCKALHRARTPVEGFTSADASLLPSC